MSTFDLLDAYATNRRELLKLRASEKREHDLGDKQMQILYRLAQGGASMGELAEYTFSDKAATTRTVASLEQAGLVKKVGHSDDRRVTLIELTAKGRTKAAHAVRFRKVIAQKVNRVLDSADRKKLVELLNKMTNKLKEGREA